MSIFSDYDSYASKMWHAYDFEPSNVKGWAKFIGARALTCILWATVIGTAFLGISEIASWKHRSEASVVWIKSDDAKILKVFEEHTNLEREFTSIFG